MTSIFVAAWNSVSGVLTGGLPNSDNGTFRALDHKGQGKRCEGCNFGACRENVIFEGDDHERLLAAGGDDFKLVFKTTRTAAHDESIGACSAPVFKSIRGPQETEQVVDQDLNEGAGVVLLYPGIRRQDGGRGSQQSLLRESSVRGGKDDDGSVGAEYNEELWGDVDCDEFVFRPRS